MSKLKKYYQKIIVIGFFFILSSLGVFFCNDYGQPWDEMEEIEITATNVKEYTRWINMEESGFHQWLEVTSQKNEIASYVEKDHGEAPYYFVMPLLYKVSNSPNLMMTVWHFYTWLIFLAGILALYCITKYLFDDWKYGLLAAVLLVTSPRFFAEGFYNNKDIVLMSLILLSIWFGMKALNTWKLGYAVLFGIVMAFSANVKIMGFWLLLLFGILYFILLFYEISKEKVISGVAAVVTFAVTFYLITPATWFSVIDYFSYVIDATLEFDRWPGFVYYQEALYSASSVPLPWHYLPVMIGITTPFVTLVLGIIGTILTGLSLIKKQKRQDNKRRYLILIFVFTIVPFLYATFGNPTIYNGWRHFYFLFGPFLIFAVYAVKVLMQKKHIQRILLIVLAIQIMVSAAGILRNHPNEFAYFNILAGADADEYYEMDYWNVSTLQCLIDLVNAEYRGETLKVAAYEDCAEEGIKKALRFLPGDYINRLEILDFSRREEAEYLIVNPSYQQRSDLIWGQFNEGVRTILLKKELNQVLSIDSYGRKIMTVYKWKK